MAITIKKFSNSFKMKEVATCFFEIGGETVGIVVRHLPDQYGFLPQYAAKNHAAEFTNTNKVVVKKKSSKEPEPIRGDDSSLVSRLFRLTGNYEEDVKWIGKFVAVDWVDIVDENGNPDPYTPEKFEQLILGGDRKAGERIFFAVVSYSANAENFLESEELSEEGRKDADVKN